MSHYFVPLRRPKKQKTYNITSFENSIDLAKEQFYKQNMAETTDVQYDILGKMQTQNRFRMSNMIR